MKILLGEVLKILFLTIIALLITSLFNVEWQTFSDSSVPVKLLPTKSPVTKFIKFMGLFIIPKPEIWLSGINASLVEFVVLFTGMFVLLVVLLTWFVELLVEFVFKTHYVLLAGLMLYPVLQ